MTRVVLIGHPVEHSLTPVMQNAGFKAADLAWSCSARNTPAAELPAVIDGLRRGEWAGANVTVPHKERVVPLLDDVDRHAKTVGAVNTIVREADRLRGYNTDGPGLLADLRALGVDLKDRPVLILGAGGAARSAAFALGQTASSLHLICRTLERGVSLAESVQAKSGRRVSVFEWNDAAFAAAEANSLVVQCTPVGMWPAVEAAPWPEGVDLPPGSFMYDLVYNPPVTRLVERARSAGLAAETGLGMLVEQGALAFELWTGMKAPKRQMRAAAEGVLL